MKNPKASANTQPKPSTFSENLTKSLAMLQKEGCSVQNLFLMGLLYCAIGLAMVNWEWMPMLTKPLGWAVTVFGLVGVIALRSRV
jgi:FtsH-binding integral membrane protein